MVVKRCVTDTEALGCWGCFSSGSLSPKDAMALAKAHGLPSLQAGGFDPQFAGWASNIIKLF